MFWLNTNVLDEYVRTIAKAEMKAACSCKTFVHGHNKAAQDAKTPESTLKIVPLVYQLEYSYNSLFLTLILFTSLFLVHLHNQYSSFVK